MWKMQEGAVKMEISLTMMPELLFSMVNMKLRDGMFSSLDDLCSYYSIEKKELLDKMALADFTFDEKENKFI